MSFKFFIRGIVATVAVSPTFTIFVVCLPGGRPAVVSRSQSASLSIFFLYFKFNYYLWDEQICAIFSFFCTALLLSFSLAGQLLALPCAILFVARFFVGTVETTRETAKAKIKLISDLLIESSPFFLSPSSSYFSPWSSPLFHLLVCRWVCARCTVPVHCTMYGVRDMGVEWIYQRNRVQYGHCWKMHDGMR